MQSKDKKNKVSSSMDIDWNNNNSIARNVVVVLDNCTFVVVVVVVVAFDMHQNIVDWYWVDKAFVSLPMNLI